MNGISVRRLKCLSRFGAGFFRNLVTVGDDPVKSHELQAS